MCVGLNCQPPVHSGALEDPQLLGVRLQAVQVVGRGLERGKMLVLEQDRSALRGKGDMVA